MEVGMYAQKLVQLNGGNKGGAVHFGPTHSMDRRKSVPLQPKSVEEPPLAVQDPLLQWEGGREKVGEEEGFWNQWVHTI